MKSKKVLFAVAVAASTSLMALRRLDSGPAKTRALGYISRGGTLDVPGMLRANRSTWVDAIRAAAEVTGWELSALSDYALLEDE